MSKSGPIESLVENRRVDLLDETSKVLVAEEDGGTQLFYVLGDPTGDDGLVVIDGKEISVPFWSYVWRMNPPPILTTAFHRNLWNIEQASQKEWLERYHLQKIPLTEEDVEALETLGVAVPPKSRPSASKDKKNKSLDNFTSVKIID